MFSVYGLCNTENGEIFYIGCTCDTKSRLSNHISDSINYKRDNRRKERYIRHLIKKNIKIEMKILSIFENREEAFDSEIKTIDEYRKINPNLTNLTLGGEGGHGLVWTRRQRRRVSKALKHYYALNPSAKESISKRQSLRMRDDTILNKIRSSLMVYYSNPFNRLKRVIISRYANSKPETRIKMSVSAKARFARKDEIIKSSVSQTNKWDKESRAKYSSMTSEAWKNNINMKNGICLKVKKFDLDNNFIEEFDSINAAARSVGVGSASLHSAMKCERPYRGFIWRRSDPTKKRSIRTNGIIKQIDVDGNVIACYRTIVEAAKVVGTNPDNISKCLSGRSNTCAKYFWRFEPNV